MKNFILVSMLVFSQNGFCLNLEFFNTKLQKIDQLDEVVKNISDESTIIMGEEHYNPLVQETEGFIVESVVKSKNAIGAFTGAWEFLDYPDQAKITEAFQNWKTDALDDQQFLTELFGTAQRGQSHEVYLPFLKSIKNLGGELLATNAPRDWKRVITSTGLSTLDPKLVPPNMELGSANYYDRFKLVMQDHVPASKLQNYYEAQCYTDSVMSYQIMSQSKFSLRFMVVGSFHSDYFDGLVESYKKIVSLPVVLFKLVDVSKMTVTEIDELLKEDPQYGPLADYIVLIRP